MKRYFGICLVYAIVIFATSCNNKEKALPKNINPQKAEEAQTVSKPYDTVVSNEFYHKELSKSFDIKVLVNRFRNLKEQHDSCVVKFTIFDKNKTLKDSFSIASNFLYDSFEDAQQVRSYSTGFNAKKKVTDGDYGNIVIADLNFDKKEDITIVSDIGASTGPRYNFYLQDSNKKFVLNTFLTDSVAYFPDEIKDNTITTFVVAGACYVHKHVYQFNAKQQTWHEKNHIVRDVCNNKFVTK